MDEHDGQRARERLHRLLGGLLGHQLLEHATRSNCVVLVRVELCADASVSAAHAGWSARSLSLSLRTNATRSAAL